MPSIVETHLSSLDFWAKPRAARDELFARLRASDEPVFCPLSNGRGFYALTRYEQVTEASRCPEVFSSQPTAVSLTDPVPETAEYTGSMISLDDPRHARLRRIVSRSFTPRMTRRFTGDVTVMARRIVDDLVECGPCDFVEHVAMPMPLRIICSMMGIPESAYDDVIDATNAILAIGDPDYVSPDGKDRTTTRCPAPSDQGINNAILDILLSVIHRIAFHFHYPLPRPDAGRHKRSANGPRRLSCRSPSPSPKRSAPDSSSPPTRTPGTSRSRSGKCCPAH